MWSLATLEWINREAARRARAVERVPFVPEGPAWVDSWPPFPFPNLGGFIPGGWQKTGSEWFVDKTGWGTVGELALTVEQFKTVLRAYIPENPGHGFAITEEGPFQVYVRAFRPVRRKRRLATKVRCQ